MDPGEWALRFVDGGSAAGAHVPAEGGSATLLRRTLCDMCADPT